MEHTVEHQLSDAGLSIESVPEFQYRSEIVTDNLRNGKLK
jgi:hypothetical protein